MTPEEKAKELIGRFMKHAYAEWHPEKGFDKASLETNAKQCAAICVQEILSSFNSFMDQRKNMRHELEIEAERYWQQVLNAINKK